MRTDSAASGKENGSTRIKNKIPRSGTRVRQVYDLFEQNKGIVIEYANRDARCLNYLMDFYGFDIRHIGRRKWVLAGEWFGSEYKDYIAEKIK